MHALVCVSACLSMSVCISEYVCVRARVRVYCCCITCLCAWMDRIDATREMCTLLKNHVTRTEDVLAVGERDKETFQQVDKQRVDEYQV